MATEKKFFYVARQNQVRDSKMFGKWYPEAYVLQTLSTRALAKHIQKHGSPYTLDVIMGVLIAFAEVTVEECMASNAVKIDGLGTFRPEIESTKGGAESKDLCDQSKVAGIHLRFTPEGSNITGEDITSRSMLKKARLERVGWVEGAQKTKNYQVHTFMDEQQPQP
jgi:predicted histone-like DNA-binding protein